MFKQLFKNQKAHLSKIDTAMVTGAGRGLGLALVGELLASGATVFAACRNVDTCEELKAMSGNLRLVDLDMNDEGGIAKVKSLVSESHQHLDLLINNAAMHPQTRGIDKFTAKGFRESLDTNVCGPLLLIKDLLPLFEHSLVINVSSDSGLEVNVEKYLSYDYGLSKCALNFATQTLAKDPAFAGNLVVSLHPGWMKTRMGGDQAPKSTADTAKAMLELALTLDERQHGQYLQLD